MRAIETHLLASRNEFTGFARRRLADPELTADAVQESLLKAVRASGSIGDAESARPWFYRILRRTIIDIDRRLDVQERAVLRMEYELDSPLTADEERVACGCLEESIATLKPRYATLVRRIDLDGEALAPVAANLGITTGNLRVRLHRARKRLRERFIQTCGLCAKHGCLDCTCETTSRGRS